VEGALSLSLHLEQLEPPPNIVFILNQYQLPILVYLKSDTNGPVQQPEQCHSGMMGSSFMAPL
jgi:hypothetical protein